MSSFTDRLYRTWLQTNGSKTAMSPKSYTRGYGGNHPHGDSVVKTQPGDIRGGGVVFTQSGESRPDKQSALDNH